MNSRVYTLEIHDIRHKVKLGFLVAFALHVINSVNKPFTSSVRTYIIIELGIMETCSA